MESMLRSIAAKNVDDLHAGTILSHQLGVWYHLRGASADLSRRKIVIKYIRLIRVQTTNDC